MRAEIFGAALLQFFCTLFVMSRRGNPMIIYEGKNFIRERSRGLRTRWVCGKKRRLQCIATLTTFDGAVIKEYGYHNHNIQFIPTEKGKYILVLRGYTYSQVGGRFFYCSSKHMGCRARVRLLSGKLVASADEHNHAPPSHARCGNGAFVQLRPRGLSNFSRLTSAILPSPISSPTVAALALHALNFPRILPKTDLWSRPTAPEDKKDP